MARSATGLRLTPIESTYALAVAVIATIGFTTGSTFLIVLSALLSLPSCVLAVPGYYVAYGLLALVPGANPSSSSQSGSCTPSGDCLSKTTGDLAVWFNVTSEIIGVLALTAAALLNVAVLRNLTARRRARMQPARRASR